MSVIRIFLVSAMLIGVVACAGKGVQTTASYSCPEPCERIKVTVPAANASPSVDKTTVTLEQDDRFAFDLDTRRGSGQTYAVFKCRDPDPANLVCLTPAVDRSGNSVWTIRMVKGQLERLTIETPADCASCADAACEDRFCKYPYMVIDINSPERPPLDPMIIIDPQ